MNKFRARRDDSEIINYEHPEIPLYIREGYLSYYPDMRALCHWHEDLEFIYIVSGEMIYYINGKTVLLKAGDSIVINSLHLHYGYAHQKKDCHFYCIIFHPSLLASNSVLYQKYVQPVIEDAHFEYMYFSASDDINLTPFLQKIFDSKKQQPETFFLESIGLFYQLWGVLYKLWQINFTASAAQHTLNEELLLQKRMVSYIYEHYHHSITLEEIAHSASVSRSRCCMIFKKYLGQSPIDFLNTYRLERSCELLRNTEKKITDICTSCGFNHLSYYSKLFQQTYHCTPREYRKAKDLQPLSKSL